MYSLYFAGQFWFLIEPSIKKSIISGLAWSDAPLPKANFDSPPYFLVSGGTSQQSNDKVDTGKLLFEYTCNANRPCRRWNSQPGVSGNSRLPYEFLGNSQEFIRQTGIPAHPCSQQTKQQFLARFFKISQSTKTLKIQDPAAVIDHKDVVKLTQLRNNPFARLFYLLITFCNT